MPAGILQPCTAASEFLFCDIRVGIADRCCRRVQHPSPHRTPKLLNSRIGHPRAFSVCGREFLARRSPCMAGENWTMWLNITNFALGIVTLLALLLVFLAVGWDL